jgi:hypothetical protein
MGSASYVSALLAKSVDRKLTPMLWTVLMFRSSSDLEKMQHAQERRKTWQYIVSCCISCTYAKGAQFNHARTMPWRIGTRDEIA